MRLQDELREILYDLRDEKFVDLLLRRCLGSDLEYEKKFYVVAF